MAVRLLIGAHISIAGGISKAPERGAFLGCPTIQIFLKNANRWNAKDLLPEEIEEFKKKRSLAGIDPVMGHDSYLINLASPDPKLRKRSEDALIKELDRCRILEIPFLVMHPGAHLGSGEKEGLERIIDSINTIMDRARGFRGHIILETTAGQGTQLGYRFEHLRTIIDGVQERERIGVCIDTCHIFAGGYDIRNEDDLNRTIMEFEITVGLDRLRLFHLNDSLRELGSRVDRHYHIGMGRIGLRAFAHIMRHPQFKEIPKIIETPKGGNYEFWDRVNLDCLRSLAL